MNKKKIISLCLVVCLAATAIIGGTLAYFTDTATESNVMTLGKLDIEIEELNKDGEEFKAEDIKILPSSNAGLVPDGTDLTEINNWVDKLVDIENLSTSTDAWLRSIILFEVPATTTEYESTDKLSVKGYNWFYNKVWVYFDVDDPTDANESVMYQLKDLVTIDGTQYAAIVCYPAKLDVYAPDTGYSALNGFAFDKSVTSAEAAALGTTYDVLVLGQGLQEDAVATKDRASIEAAFEAAFGKVTADNVAAWFAGDDMAD